MTDEWQPLKKFLESQECTHDWVSIQTPNYLLKAYLRKTSHYLNDRKYRTIDVGSIDVAPQKVGGCSALLTILESLSEFEAIYIEGVLNEHLESHLVRRGYERFGNPYQPNYVRFTTNTTPQQPTPPGFPSHNDEKPKKIRTKSLDDSLRLVRERYPNVTLEGSTGLNYSFWIDRQTVVATTWEMRGPSHDWWLVFTTQIV